MGKIIRGGLIGGCSRLRSLLIGAFRFRPRDGTVTALTLTHFRITASTTVRMHQWCLTESLRAAQGSRAPLTHAVDGRRRLIFRVLSAYQRIPYENRRYFMKF